MISNTSSSNTSSNSGGRQTAATLFTSGIIKEDEEGLDDVIVGFQFLTKASSRPNGIAFKTGEGPNIPKT